MREELFQLRQKCENGSCAEITFRLPGDGGTCIRRFRTPDRLILLGGGHISRALCRFAAELEFAVTVTDDRPAFANSRLFPQASEVICDTFENAIARLKITAGDYVVVATRGHRQDAACLRVLLDEASVLPGYLGMLGSRRRIRELFGLLESEGFAREDLEQIHTPIGLSIGAVTPEEIAVSILAELIRCRRAAGRSDEGVLEQTNADPGVLRFLEQPEEKVVAVVTERHGSTPVKTGAFLAVDRIGNAYGTVGGGCGEHEVIRKALQVFRQQEDCMMTVDMSNDIAMEEGMVCGGKMQVALYYIPPMEM